MKVNLKKIVALLALALCLLLGSALGESELNEEYQKVSQKGELALYLNEQTGEIAVEDLRDGYLWKSNPNEADPKAKGIYKMTLQSQLLIGFTSEKGTALTAVSQADSFNQGGYGVKIEQDEIISTYDFPKLQITVTLHYALKNDGLEVWIDTQECLSYGLNQLTSIEVLPAFGAGGSDEQGYLFVPDGSGALIHFNNGATSMNEYKANVYGRDPSVTGQIGLSSSPPLARTYEQTVRLPVFGINKEDHGLFAIITENDSKGVIHGRVSNLSSYNYAYSEFQLLNSGSVIMNKKEFGQSVTGVSERKGLTTGSYKVRYLFLNGSEQSSYSGMARVYRNYLINEKGLNRRTEENNYPLYLDVYGYIDKTAHFLGVPYTKAYPLTTLEDVGKMTGEMGIDQTVVRYRQFLQGITYGKLPSGVKIEKSLGNVKELTDLAQILKNRGGNLYPDVDMHNVYKTGRGFHALVDAVLTPVNSPQMQYQINYGNSKMDMTVAPWYLLSPMKYEYFYNRYLESYQKLNMGTISLSTIGRTLTADNRSGGMGRQDAEQEVEKILTQTAEQIGQVMINGGNAYGAALATHVLETPGNSSEYLICDETVPFYQMVFHGYVYYSLSATNHLGSPDDMVLKCLETGASPLFSFVAENQDKLMDSRMRYLFSPDYRAWTQTVQEHYDKRSAVLASLSTQEITLHEILADKVRMTQYETCRVYVNYSNQPYQVDEIVISPKGYVVKEVAQP